MEPEPVVREFVVLPEIRHCFRDSLNRVEPLKSDDYFMCLTYFLDEIQDLWTTRYVFDPGESYPVGGYTVEPSYPSPVDCDIRVESDDCLVGVLVNFQEPWSLDA